MAKKKGQRMRVTLVKSVIGSKARQRGTVQALGLKRINHSVEHEDSPVLRGMLNKVAHLVQVEEVE